MQEESKDKQYPRQDPPNMPGDIPPGTGRICNRCGQIHDEVKEGSGG